MEGTVISGRTAKKEQQSVMKDVMKLFNDRHVSPVFLKSILMYTVSVNLAMLSMYHVTHMNGNKFHNLIVLGIGLSCGNLLSGMVIRVLNIQDWIGYIISLGVVIVCSVSSTFELPDWLVYFIFFAQVFSVGMCLNLQYIIFGTRMNPLLVATSLELCFCFANVIASTVPILAAK
jgi:predicted MFS family arabinose efflux permease